MLQPRVEQVDGIRPAADAAQRMFAVKARVDFQAGQFGSRRVAADRDV